MAMPALLIRKWTPPSFWRVSSTNRSTGHSIAHIAARGEDADAHRGERGLGEQRLLGHIAARHVHEAERHVAAEPAELHCDGSAEAGGAAGHDGHLAAPPLPDRLGLRLFDRRAGAFDRFEFPGRSVAEPEGWQWHGTPKVRRDRKHGKKAEMLLCEHARETRLGPPRPGRRRCVGRAGPASRRDHQRRLAGPRRRRHLPRRLPLLQPFSRQYASSASTTVALRRPSG